MLTNILGRFSTVGLKVQKYIPEICMGAGAALTVIGGFECCKSTLKVEAVIDKAKDDIELIHDKVNHDDEYTSEMAKKETTKVYFRTGLDFLKVYSKGIAMASLGLGMMFYGYGVLDGRFVGAAAASNVWEARFNKLEEGVINKYGKDVRDELLYGITREDVELDIVNEDGEVKTKKYKKARRYNEETDLSEFAIFFGPGNPNWEKNPSYNLMWLRGIENYCNDLLRSRKHLLVNDILDALGEKRTADGAVNGWLYDNGNTYISFGIDWEDGEKHPGVRAFLNGMEPSVWLDIRPQGLIWNLI